jgi:hypothetical protein
MVRMNGFVIAVGIVIAIGVVLNVVLQLRKPQTMNMPVDLSKELAKMEKDLEAEKREKNELSGKGKELYDRFKSLESEYKSAVKERDALQTTLTKLESKKEQQERENRQQIEKLESAQQALKEERQRVIAEEERNRAEREEERDRIWNEHENAVIATLSELCKQPHLHFTSYSNNNLPDEFDGKLKPDFLIDFLGQYVVFDAKASKAESLQTYINDAVKTTAEKIKKNGRIYPHVFLVVPTEAIGELKKLIYAKDEYYFYVVSREALAPILASLKRISTYELAETLDPQKRENIINMIAELATHISYRNAHELLLTSLGADTLQRVSAIDPEIAADVEQKRNEKKLSRLPEADIKRLANNLMEQNLAMQQLVSPKAAIKKKDIEAAQSSMTQKLL